MDAAQGARRYKPTLPRDFKSNRAATVHATVQPQRSSRSTTAPALQTLAFRDSHGALNFVFVRVCSVSQGDACNHDHISTYNSKVKPTSLNLILLYLVQYKPLVGVNRDSNPHSDAPPFQLATTPGFQVKPRPEGGACIPGTFVDVGEV